MPANPIRRYLERYAEPVVMLCNESLCRQLGRTFRSVLVVPAYDESPSFLERLLPAETRDVLVIVAVNAAADRELKSIQRTQTLLAELSPGSAPLRIVRWNAGTTLLLVDCCSDGRQLPAKQGVGLARKIGADLALACIEYGLVTTPWIYCTDADAILPQGYFDDGDWDEDVDAAVVLYPFTHQPVHEHILHYEISLRYYALQLAWAGSAYGFHTIGSLLKIRDRHYAAVRGFPKRKAAEDFYMLNKLAKTGKVVRLTLPQLVLSSRISLRVPFGTGATMQRLSAQPELRFYHPDIFRQLRVTLTLLDDLWRWRDSIQHLGLVPGLQTIGFEDEIVVQALLQLGFEKVLHQAYRQCCDRKRFQFFLRVWFDAFRTLKFVHYLRDKGLPSVSLSDAMTSMRPVASVPKNPASTATLSQLQYINTQLIHQETQLPAETGPTVQE